MANEIYTNWIVPQSVSVASLHSLAAGNIWHSDNITSGPLAGKQHILCRVSYRIDLAAAATAGDKLDFYILYGDEHATNEIWDGNVTESESAITVAADKLAITDNAILARSVSLSASGNATNQQGSFEVKQLSPHFIIALHNNGVTAIAASGSRIHYRYFDTQGQA